MKQFTKNPLACTEPNNPIMAGLIQGWGNEGWSASAEYLAECVSQALKTPGPILECGSGLSTLLIGTIATRRNLEYWVLEHVPEWARKVEANIMRFNLNSVSMCVDPLADYGEFSWYNPPLNKIPATFSLIICDGPPAITKGGRVGLVPTMKDRLRPGCIILLDDASRNQEAMIARRWQSDINASLEFCGSDRYYAKLTVQ